MRVPDLIYCANGNRRFAEIAKSYGFLIGAQLPGTIYDVHKPLYFADQDFKKPRYVDYIKAIRKYQPYMASVLDLEEWRRLDEYLMRADEISRYCHVVMLIPKTNGIIKELPREINGKQVRLVIQSLPSLEGQQYLYLSFKIGQCIYWAVVRKDNIS